MKRTTMELGGNAPFLIFGDADIDSAVSTDGLEIRNSGQTCVCANRILVEDQIREQFANALKQLQKLSMKRA